MIVMPIGATIAIERKPWVDELRALLVIGRGAAVVIDPNDGGILAMASVPTFDPNKFIPAITPEDFKRYNGDDSHPLISRAIGTWLCNNNI